MEWLRALRNSYCWCRDLKRLLTKVNVFVAYVWQHWLHGTERFSRENFLCFLWEKYCWMFLHRSRLMSSDGETLTIVSHVLNSDALKHGLCLLSVWNIRNFFSCSLSCAETVSVNQITSRARVYIITFPLLFPIAREIQEKNWNRPVINAENCFNFECFISHRIQKFLGFWNFHVISFQFNSDWPVLRSETSFIRYFVKIFYNQ